MRERSIACSATAGTWSRTSIWPPIAWRSAAGCGFPEKLPTYYAAQPWMSRTWWLKPMIGYILKRLALMVPTMFGILLVSFAIIQFVPGGPVDQLVQELRGRGQGGEVTVAVPGYRGAQGIDAQRLKQINEMYGFDKPAPQRFLRDAQALSPIRPRHQLLLPEIGLGS